MDYPVKLTRRPKMIPALPFCLFQLPTELIDHIVYYFNHVNDILSVVSVNKNTLTLAKTWSIKKCKKYYTTDVNRFKLAYNIIRYNNSELMKVRIFGDAQGPCKLCWKQNDGLYIIGRLGMQCAFRCYKTVTDLYQHDISSYLGFEDSDSDYDGFVF